MSDFNFIGPINTTGYGQVSKNLLKELCKRNNVYFDTSILNIVDDRAFLDKECKTSKTKLAGAPYIIVWHHFDSEIFSKIAEPKTLITFFERDFIPENEIKNLNNSIKSIVVSSEYSRKTLLNCGYIGNIFVIHPGVDSSIFNNTIKRKTESTFRFFCAGKYEIRKGYDILINTFAKSFDKHEDVELLIHGHNPIMIENVFNGKNMTKDWITYCEHKSIKIKNTKKYFDTQKDLARIIREETDCGVFLNRSEGWNLELAEVIACGKPVIASNATAHEEFREYCTEMIDYNGLEMAFEPPFFNGNSKWPCPNETDIKNISTAMRRAYINGKTENPKSQDFVNSHSWGLFCQKVIEVAL